MIENPGKRRATAGFSLVEMAVVTLLIGIFLTMGLSAFRATREASAVSQTQTRENEIKDALIAYLRRNNRLPCADTNFSGPDGIENRGGTTGTPPVPDPATPCATAPSNARFGIVPYVTLGLARDAAVDGWGNFFGYQVSNTTSTTNTDWTLSANLRSGNTGILTVMDRNAAGTPSKLTANAVVVVLSYGSDGFGAYTVSGTRNTLPGSTTDEYQNTNASGGTTFFSRTQTTDDTAVGGAFDDRVMYLSADDLLGPLFKDGALMPPAAKLAADFTLIKNAIGQYALTNASYWGGANCDSGSSTLKCRVIPQVDSDANGTPDSCCVGGVPYEPSLSGVAAGDVIDPWGQPIRYSVLAADLTSTGWGNGLSSSQPVPISSAYSLRSAGPNQIFGDADDSVVTVLAGDLQASLAGALP